MVLDGASKAGEERNVSEAAGGVLEEGGEAMSVCVVW